MPVKAKILRRADAEHEVRLFGPELLFAPTRPVQQLLLMKLVQLSLDAVSAQLLGQGKHPGPRVGR
jgi:hypothetical protein